LNSLKRLTIVVIAFSLIVIFISLFIPNTLTINTSIKVDADKELIQKQLNTYALNSLDGYKLDKESINWQLTNLNDTVEISPTIKIKFGFNPISKFFGLFAEKNVKHSLNKKLDSLKIFLEDLPRIKQVKVSKVMMKENLWFLSIRDTVKQNEMNNIHGKLYAKINTFMDKHNIVSQAAPLVIYHFWSDSIVDLEAGIPIKDSTIKGNGKIKLNKINKGYVVTATHYGSYDRLPETYFGINEWMRKNKVTVIGAPWEVYITDPDSEPNPNKWETAIYFPIK